MQPGEILLQRTQALAGWWGLSRALLDLEILPWPRSGHPFVI